MKITIQSPDLQRELQFAASFNDLVLLAAKTIVLERSEWINETIKNAMPYRTGRAAASWGKWTPGMISIFTPEIDPDDAIWEVSDDELTIVQGTGVPYVPNLNEGSSEQAPRGFIDAIAMLALEDLTLSVSKGVDEVWYYGK